MTTITKLTSVEDLKEIWIEAFLNNTDKVTKVSDFSVLSGIAYANSTIAFKALKDISLVESSLFLETASGEYLDQYARNLGLPGRLGPSGSSTSVRVVGSEGTTYTPLVHTVTGSHGITFNFDEEVTIGPSGFAYAVVSSQTTGMETNVKPFTLNQVNPVPSGHSYITNEYIGTGGSGSEDDIQYRFRLKNSFSSASFSTLERLQFECNKADNRVLRVFYRGMDRLSRPVLELLSSNGGLFSVTELDSILDSIANKLPLQNINISGEPKLVLRNVSFYALDLSFRVKLQEGTDPDTFRIKFQSEAKKLYDYRFWNKGKIHWEDLLFLMRGFSEAQVVPDSFVSINGSFRQDVSIPRNKLPRFRGFHLFDLNGELITNFSGTLNPIYFPTTQNKIFSV